MGFVVVVASGWPCLIKNRLHFDVRLQGDRVGKGCSETTKWLQRLLPIKRWFAMADGDSNCGSFVGTRRNHSYGRQRIGSALGKFVEESQNFFCQWIEHHAAQHWT